MILDGFGRLRPFERQVDDLSRRPDSFQRPQGCFQNGHLPLIVAGLSQGTPQRVLDRRDAGDADRGGQIRDGGQVDRGKAGGFQLTLYQSYGPAADRSGGHQHDDIRQILFQIADQGWNRLR